MNSKKKLILLLLLLLAACNNTHKAYTLHGYQELKIAQFQTNKTLLKPIALAPLPINQVSAPYQNLKSAAPLFEITLKEKELSDVTNKVNSDNTKNETIASDKIAERPRGLQKTNLLIKNPNFIFMALAGLFAALTLSLFIPFIPKSKKIAFWAMENRKTTRAIIFTGQNMAGLAGMFLGKVMFGHGIIATAPSTYALAGITSAVALLYPYRKVKNGLFRHTYAKQKVFDLLISLCFVTMFANIGNRATADDNFSKPASAVIHSFDKIENTVFASHSTPNYAMAAKVYNRTNGIYAKNANAGQDIAIFFIILFLILLLALLAILACIIACNGQGLPAIVLLLGGGALLIWAGVSAVRSIREGK